MPGVDPAEALDHDPDVERHHERDERAEREREPELAMAAPERLREDRAPLGVYPGEALRMPASFQASACSSSQIFW